MLLSRVMEHRYTPSSHFFRGPLGFGTIFFLSFLFLFVYKYMLLFFPGGSAVTDWVYESVTHWVSEGDDPLGP